MSKGKYAYLLFQKDFSEKGKDRYFIYEDNQFFELDSETLVDYECFLITHDFWLVANSLFKKHGYLPKNIVDVVLLERITLGVKARPSGSQVWDIDKTIKKFYKDKTDFRKYLEIFYRRAPVEETTLILFAHKLEEYFEDLHERAYSAKETNRFFCLEMPLYRSLLIAASRGIKVDQEKVKEHKENIKIDFYSDLKNFSEKHNVLYEVPSDGYIKEKLLSLGYNVADYSTEFLIDFLPAKEGYTDDLRKLQKVNKSFRAFNSISSHRSRVYPILESHSTVTSRIYHKAPNLQNIAKKYRDIFVADDGFRLCYIDYDQFEVGIMAALSGDEKMKVIYQNSDPYTELSEDVLGDKSLRKTAKRIFLSFTYGMSLENIIKSVDELGGDSTKAKAYFSQFTQFESWKQKILTQFSEQGRVGTIEGNFLNRTLTGDLTQSEKRSAANHVIQGTGSFIFKSALLKLSKIADVQVLIPMHDAVLFQHKNTFDPKDAINIFEQTMSKILGHEVNGKASEELFFQPST